MQADWYTNNLEDLQFPLPVQDANMEVISRLDDNTLYRLCQTNKYLEQLCSSNEIWFARPNSPLAPLLFLRGNYKDWIDFYENVRNDYVYVVSKKIANMRGQISYYNTVFSDITTAIRTMIGHYPRKLSDDEVINKFIARKPYGDIKIKLARKNVRYNRDNVGDYILYDALEPEKYPNILSYPKLSVEPILKLSTRRSHLMFVDITHEQLRNLQDSKAFSPSIELTKNNVGIYTFGEYGWRLFDRVNERNYLILKGSYTQDPLLNADKYYVVIIPEIVADNGKVTSIDELYVAYNESREAEGYGESPVVPSIKRANEILQYVLRHGTFYELEDIGPVLNTL